MVAGGFGFYCHQNMALRKFNDANAFRTASAMSQLQD
jgi:hypothetical protein